MEDKEQDLRARLLARKAQPQATDAAPSSSTSLLDRLGGKAAEEDRAGPSRGAEVVADHRASFSHHERDQGWAEPHAAAQREDDAFAARDRPPGPPPRRPSPSYDAYRDPAGERGYGKANGYERTGDYDDYRGGDRGYPPRGYGDQGAHDARPNGGWHPSRARGDDQGGWGQRDDYRRREDDRGGQPGYYMDHEGDRRGPAQPEHSAPGAQGGGWGRRVPRPEGAGGNEYSQGDRPPPPSRFGGPPPLGGGSESFLAARQEQRDAMKEVVIWPASPRDPYLDSDEQREKRKKEKEERRKRKASSSHHKSRSHRDRDRSRSRDRSHKHSSSSRHHGSSSRRHREEEDDRRDSRHRSSRHSSSKRRYSDTDSSASDSEDEADRRRRRHGSSSRSKHHHSSSRRHRTRSASPSSHRKRRDSSTRQEDSAEDKDAKAVELKNGAASDEEEDDEVGPQLPVNEQGQKIDPRR